jgi:hypothetical protein
MAIKRYDVVAVTGTYTDRNGNERKRYLNCGVVFETDKGLSLKLEALPVGHDGWFQLYEPRSEEQQAVPRQTGRPQASAQAAPARQASFSAGEDFEDDIPF